MSKLKVISLLKATITKAQIATKLDEAADYDQAVSYYESTLCLIEIALRHIPTSVPAREKLAFMKRSYEAR